LRPVDDKAEQRATASRQTAGCELKRPRLAPVLFRIARIAPPNGHFSGFFRALGYCLGVIPRVKSEGLRFARSLRTSRLNAALRGRIAPEQLATIIEAAAAIRHHRTDGGFI
jgi:hypothetical protein